MVLRFKLKFEELVKNKKAVEIYITKEQILNLYGELIANNDIQNNDIQGFVAYLEKDERR